MTTTRDLYSSQVVIRRLLSYVRPFWHVLLLGIIGTVLFTSVDSAATYILKPLIDKGFVERDINFIRWVPFVLFGAFFVRGAASFLSSYCMTYVARSMVMAMRQQMFRHLQRISASYYDKATSGKLLSKLLYDVEQIAYASTDTLTTFLQSFCFTLGLLIVMVIISWKLSLLFFVSVPLIVLVVRYTNKRVRDVSHRVQRAMGDVTEIAQENIEGYREVRIFGGQECEIEKFDQATRASRGGDLKVAVAKAISVSGVQVIASFSIAIIVDMAINPTFSTSLTAGGFSSLMLAMLALLKPLKTLTRINSDVQRGLAGARSIFAFCDTKGEADEGKAAPHDCKGKITYESVSFSYKADEPVLQDINLTVSPGETIALVGRSGSGKTTLASLLARFYETDRGTISIDDIDIRELSLENLRSHIALVGQHVTLFNGTIRENIAYALPNVSFESIRAAAKAAHALDFIEQFPQGFDTIIGDNGALLSGGERQRIAIARAVLKDAPILILDEATSALDSEAERRIQAALEALMANRTTLVIAHRLSTIESADNIVVIDKGQIKEQGKHHELLQLNGHYARLHAMQLQSTTNSRVLSDEPA